MSGKRASERTLVAFGLILYVIGFATAFAVWKPHHTSGRLGGPWVDIRHANYRYVHRNITISACMTPSQLADYVKTGDHVYRLCARDFPCREFGWCAAQAAAGPAPRNFHLKNIWIEPDAGSCTREVSGKRRPCCYLHDGKPVCP